MRSAALAMSSAAMRSGCFIGVDLCSLKYKQYYDAYSLK